MKEKHLKIFAGVFVSLLVLYFVTKPRHKSVNLDEFVQTVVFGVSKEDVKEVEIYKETEGEPARMVFTMEGDQWKLPTYHHAKVQQSRIDRILDEVLEMTGKVRSTEPKHLDKYKIADTDGLHLLFKDVAGKTLVNLIIGKKGEDANSGFVRFAGKDKVYYTDKNLLSALSVYGAVDTLTTFKQSSFADLQAVDQKKEDLQMVGLVKNRHEMIIKQIEKEVEETKADSTVGTTTEKEWVLVKGKREIELDQKEVSNYLRDVTRIRASAVEDHIGNSLKDLNKKGQYGLGHPSRYLVFVDPDGQQQNILFGKSYEKNKGHYMYVEYDGLVYKLSQSNYDKIFKWFDELPKKLKKEDN